MDSVTHYKLQKKQRWIHHQLAQRMLVTCRFNNRLTVVKKVTLTEKGLIVNGDPSKVLKTQPLYASHTDPTNPVGTFRDESLDVAEYVDLICKCIW